MSNQVLYRQKYNGRRRTLAAEDRENRFIVDYLRHKHPDIHRDVKKLYAEFKTKYPTKHDLKKTKEYEEMITGAPTKKYKYSRHLTIKDNMVLTIELSDNPANVPVDATVAQPANIPVDANVALPDDVPVDATVAPPANVPVDANVAPPDDVPVDATVAPPANIPVDVNVVPPDDVPVDATVAPVDTAVAPPDDVPFPDLALPFPDLALPFPDLELPYMTEETMELILQELRQDPTTACIMDRMNDECDDIFW